MSEHAVEPKNVIEQPSSIEGVAEPATAESLPQHTLLHDTFKRMKRYAAMLADERLAPVLGCMDCEQPITLVQGANQAIRLECACCVRVVR